MTVFEALPVDRTARITTQARQWSFGRTALAAVRVLLSALAWVLVGVGRSAYWLVAGMWLTCTWTAAAVKVGWDDARTARETAGG